jgi:hypothetical protein
MAFTRPLLRNPLPAFFLSVVAVIESVWILRSNGFYPVDECAHFLYSRFVLSALPVTVQTWHRPGRLWLFALPAQLGHQFTMFFCLALFLCLLLVTYRIAVLMNIRHAAWAVILTGLQPILFDISYACLAETPAALVLALSYWSHLKGRHGWSLAIASAVFLFRFEMYAFAILLFILYLRRREWRVLPLLLLGPLLWIGSSAVISGDIMTFFTEWSKFSHLGKYVPGIPVVYYVENLHTIFGTAQVLLFASGVIFIVRAKRTAGFGIIFCAIAINIAVNTLAGAEVFHWTGSVGEFRYVAVVAPFVGIVAALGMSEILERVKQPGGRIALSLLVFGAVVFNCTLTTHPRRWANYETIVITMTGTLREEYPDMTLLSNNCIAAYVMDVPPSGGEHFEKLDEAMIAKYPRCLILWDPYSSNPRFFQTGLTAEKLLLDSTMTVVDRYTYWDAEYIAFLRNARPVHAPR